MAVRKVNGRWLVEFMQGGHRVFKRLPENATRADATQYEAKLRREIFDQATLGKRRTIGGFDNVVEAQAHYAEAMKALKSGASIDAVRKTSGAGFTKNYIVQS